MVELVSEGKGWAVMAPTNIYRGGLFLSGVRLASLPAPGLQRTQKVLARTDEFIPLAGRIAGWCRELCLSTVKPLAEGAFFQTRRGGVPSPAYPVTGFFSAGRDPKLSHCLTYPKVLVMTI